MRDFFDFALLCAFADFPKLGTDPSQFFNEEIRSKIFLEYKEKLNKKIQDYYGDTSKNISDLLYNPIAYTLFGEFDLAVFSFIDDFGFASRKFKPSSTPTSFKYQINAGVVPLFTHQEEKPEYKTQFQNKMKALFKSSDMSFPFIAITSLKLNDALLAGVGDDFFEFIIRRISKVIDEEIIKHSSNNDLETGHRNLFYILSENLGWNEITIYFFSRSMNLIKDVVFKIRSIELNISVLMEDRSRLDELLKDSLFCFMREQNGSNTSINYPSPIVSTTTTFGLDIRLFNKKGINDFKNEELTFLNRNIDHPKFETLIKSSFIFSQYEETITISWKVKPSKESRLLVALQELERKCFEKFEGQTTSSLSLKLRNEFKKFTEIHLERLIDKMVVVIENKSINTSQVLIRAGKHSMVFPYRSISVVEYLDFLEFLQFNNDFTSEINKLVTSFKSDIYFYGNQLTSYVKIKDPDIEVSDGIKPLQFPLTKKLSRHIRRLPISSLIEDQLENIIVNYNSAITDPLAFNYFVGLRSSISEILKIFFQYTDLEEVRKNYSIIPKLKLHSKHFEVKSHNSSLRVISIEQKTLLEFIVTWDKAYWNRLYHSNSFADLSDHGVTYHGGVHQLIFGYDTAYKVICNDLYGTTHQFTTVFSDPVVKSNKFGVKLNLVHLYSPVIFATEWIHEAANHYLEHYILNSEENKKYKYLIPPDISRLKHKDIEQAYRFINEIKRKLIIEDEGLNAFFDKYFGVNIIRYTVTDYLTYRLSYKKALDDFPKRLNSELLGVSIFNHSYWFSALSKTSYYEVLEVDQSEWVFSSEAFDYLFIRINLMYYMFGLAKDQRQMKEFNGVCPSKNLERFWNERCDLLIEFVINLGSAIDSILNETTTSSLYLNLEKDINSKIENLSESTKTLIQLNSDLIRFYFSYFRLDKNGIDNSVIREYESLTNISGDMEVHELDAMILDSESNKKMSMLFDPRGYLLILNPEVRRLSLGKNIRFYKQLNNIAQKWIINLYQKHISKNSTKNA